MTATETSPPVNERHTAERASGLKSRYMPPVTAEYGWGCQLGRYKFESVAFDAETRARFAHGDRNCLGITEKVFELVAFGPTWLAALANWHSKQPKKLEAAA